LIRTEGAGGEPSAHDLVGRPPARRAARALLEEELLIVELSSDRSPVVRLTEGAEIFD
jgi:hypothetical protein